MPETIKTKVLVVDDEQMIANTLVVILIQAGFDARAVYSGEEAVEMARSFQPNMLVSDVVMTGITGIEAAIEVRSILPSCKVLLFSGQAVTVDLLAKARARKYEFEVLAKPVHPRDLLAKLRTSERAPEIIASISHRAGARMTAVHEPVTEVRRTIEGVSCPSAQAR